ncbi:hypothetical protein CSUI_008674, partial [Cystoisospora suis]
TRLLQLLHLLFLLLFFLLFFCSFSSVWHSSFSSLIGPYLQLSVYGIEILSPCLFSPPLFCSISYLCGLNVFSLSLCLSVCLVSCVYPPNMFLYHLP